MADKIEKIYVIRAEGSGAVKADLTAINKLFKEIAKSKEELNATKGSTEDPVILAKVNAELDKLATKETELVAAKRSALDSARQEITANNQLIGTYQEIRSQLQGINAANAGSLGGGAAGQAQAVQVLATAQAELVVSSEASIAATNAQSAANVQLAGTTEQVSAAILAGRAVEQKAIDDTLSMEQAQEALNAEYAETKALAAQVATIQAETSSVMGTAAESTQATEEAFVGVSARVVQIGQELETVNAQINATTAAWEAGAISTQQYNQQIGALKETQVGLKAELSETSAALKQQIALERSTANSINEARAIVKQLTVERNNLNLKTATGVQRQKELNAQIDRYNAFIKENVDLYQKQKINIGNYPTLTAELRAVRNEMEKMVAAGKQDSVVFQQLQARAKELTATMDEVKDSLSATKEAQTAQNVLVEKAGKAWGILRKAAQILPGFGIAGLIALITESLNQGVTAFIDWVTGADKAVKTADKLTIATLNLEKAASTNFGQEVSKLEVLKATIEDVNVPMKNRLQAVKDIQEQFPAYFKNLTTEQILTGKVGDAYVKTTEAIRASARVRTFGEELGTVEGQLAHLSDNINRAVAGTASSVQTGLQGYLTFIQNTPSIPEFLTGEKDKKGRPIKQDVVTAINKYNLLLLQAQNLTQKIKDNLGQAASINPISAPTKTKAAKDFTKEELSGLNELAAAKEALQKQDLEQSILTNKAIADNETLMLEERLDAYKTFSDLREQQARIASEKEIEIEKNKIASIDEQLAKKDNTQDQIKALEDRRKAANLRIKASEKRLKADILRITQETQDGVKKIMESDVAIRLRGVDAIRANAQSEADARLEALQDSYQKGLISFKEFKRKEKELATEAHVVELNLIKQYLEEEIAAFDATGRDASALRTALASINKELSKAKSGAFDAAQAGTFNLQDFYAKLKETSISVAGEIAAAWTASQQKQIDKDLQLRQTRLDTEMQARLNQATSASERIAIEQEYAKKQEALQREGFNRQKRLSEKALALEFAVASMKAINQALSIPGAGIFEAIAAEAIVALEYAAKLAVLESQKFARGGEVPTQGGEFGGRPHSAGGTKFGYGNRMFEAEEGELAILNKRTSRHRGRFMVSGTPRQIASALNVAGGGVSFAPGAMMRKFEYGGSLGATLPAPQFIPSSGSVNGDAVTELLQAASLAVRATNSRFDTLRVVLDPRAVQSSNRQANKNVQLGQL